MSIANAFKNGAVRVTLSVMAICKVVERFGPKLIAYINDQATAGTITTAQATQLIDMLTVVQAACVVWRQMTGY